MTLRDSLLAALVAVVWGLNFVVIDWGMQEVPPLLFVAVRFVAVVFPAVLLVPRPRVPLRTLLAVGGFMSLGQFGLLYASIAAGMPPGLASLVLQAQVVLTIVIAAGALREWPTSAQVAGVALGAVGLVVVGTGRGGDVPLLALLLCVAAALSWAVGNVVVRSAGVVAGLSLTVWSALVVPLPALALAVLVHGGDAVVAGLVRWSWQAIGVHSLHGRAGIAGRLRPLQRPARAVALERRRPVDPARARGRHGLGVAAGRRGAQRGRGGGRRAAARRGARGAASTPPAAGGGGRGRAGRQLRRRTD